MLRRASLFVMLLSLGASVHASVPANVLMLPIVGRAVGSAGREFRTAVSIVSTGEPAEVTLRFRAAGSKGAAVESRVSIPADGSATLDLDRTRLGSDHATGSLEIDATRPVSAVARITARNAGAEPGSELSTTFEAIPRDRAIGNGETTTIPALSVAAGEFKLYVVETTGQPLHVEISAVGPDGKAAASKRMFIDASQQAVVPLVSTLALRPGFTGWVKVAGVNGSGKVVAAGEVVATVSRDSSAVGMVLPLEPRHRLSTGELLLYGAIAVLLLAAALRRA